MTNDCGKTGAAASTRGRFPASGQQSHSSRWVQHRPESSTAAVAVVVNLSQFKRKIIESALACAMYETTAPAMTGSSSSNNSRGSHSANINTTKGTNIGTLPFPTTTTVRSSLLKAARGRSSSSSSSKTFHSRSSRNYSIDPSFVPPPSKRVCQGSNNYRTNSGGGGVSFNPDVDYYEGSPYEPGRSDAEAIALYQHDIWYSQADYDSFLKDRADTLRVYHSVNGDLSCLKNHYSVRGLEHSIRGNSSPIWQIQKDQKALVATVLAEQDRQNITGLVDPDALRHQAAMRTAKSMLQAFQRGQMDAVEATACEVDYEEDDDDSDEDHEDEGDVETESHCEKSLSSKAETASNSPPLDLPKNTAIGKLSCVDVMSLHNMNLHLLEQLRNPTNPKRLRPTKNGKGALLSPFDDLDKELEQWDALYENQRKRRDSLSKVSRPEVSTTKVTSSLHKDANVTLADATECAISIANLRCDSLRNMGESSSYSGNHSPSLLELQAQRRHRQTGLVPATLD